MRRERRLRCLMRFFAGITLTLMLLLLGTILIRGVPGISLQWLLGTYARRADAPSNGILPMLLNTLLVITVTLGMAIPIGLGCALWLSQYAGNGKLVSAFRFAVGTLAGLPSILFGLFGYEVFCCELGLRPSLLAGCLTMTLCVLPMLITSFEAALLAVPKEQIEAACALGAQQSQLICHILFPGAAPRLYTAIVLAIGRIAGESAALLFTAGIGYAMPGNPFSHLLQSGRTLTVHLYQLARESGTEAAMEEAFATAAVLLGIVFLCGRAAAWFRRKGGVSAGKKRHHFFKVPVVLRRFSRHSSSGSDHSGR